MTLKRCGADRDRNNVRTFMSVGNSSFFPRPVAATMFPTAPVVLSATAETHTHTQSCTHTHVTLSQQIKSMHMMLALFCFSIDYRT